MSFKPNNIQIAELFIYKLHCKCMWENPLYLGKLPWFDELPIDIRKDLLDRIKSLFEALDEKPDLPYLPLSDELNLYREKKEQELEELSRTSKKLEQELMDIIKEMPNSQNILQGIKDANAEWGLG
jgi:hypothetical protein